MPLSDLKPLARWKHAEVIYARLTSGGLSERQRDRLRAELETALEHVARPFRVVCTSRDGRVAAQEHPMFSTPSLMS